MRRIKNLIFTVFALMVLTLCLSFDSQAAMTDSQIKGRLSAYSSSYVEVKDGICYLEYPDWDPSEEKMYEVISGVAEALMGAPVKDYCTVKIKFFFSPENYSEDFQFFFDELTLVKKKFGNFFTEWSRHNKMTMSVTSYSGGDYFSANFELQLNGSEQDKYGKEYDEKILSLVSQAQKQCSSNMETVQFFLGWLDENARYLILTGFTNDPRYALLVGYTVCGGYANAFKDLCNAAGIPAIVPVNMQANHAWNQVYVDGMWYTADLCDVVKSQSGTYNGYLFTDPDLSTDCNDFVEKHKKEYVESFKYKDTVSISACSFEFKSTAPYSGKEITPSLKVTFGGKTLKKGVHYNVTYKNNKYPGTGKIIVSGITDNGYRSSKTLSFDIELPKTKITATPGKSSVKLKWNSVSGVDGYIVSVYDEKKKEYKELMKVKGTSCTVEKLSAGKKYKLAVKSYVQDNGSIYRGGMTKITSFTYPGKVKSLRATNITESSIKVKWNKIETAEKYEVQISTDGKNWKKLATVKKNYYTAKKLDGNKKYFFRVRAISKHGNGAFSDKKRITTLVAKPVVEISAGKTSITVSWKKVSGADGYVAYCAANKNMLNNKRITVKKSSAGKVTFKKLKSKKNYFVRVRAFKNINGERVYGKYSAVTKIKTK